MKKIVMGLAALSMAASMFAADISAGTKIKGSLFGLDKDGKITALQQANDSHDYANPNFVLSVSGEKAGADLKITTDGIDNNGKQLRQTTQTIWFKPFDVLKVTVGNYDVALNKETIDWTESWTGLGGQGFLTQLTIEGFSLDLGMNPGEGNWLSKAKDADAVLANTFVKVGYSADFGNIGAYVALNKADPNTWDGNYGYYALEPKAGTIKNMDFGAGYKNTFGPVTTFVQVVGHMEENFEWIRPELFVSGNADAFGYNLFVAPVIFTNSDLGAKTACELVAKVSYGINGYTPYVYFKDANLMADKFTSTIKVGCTGNLGPMGWNVWAEIGTGEKTTFSVPFELSVNF